MNENYYNMYLKYKNKYLTLKSKINNEQKGGAGFYLTFLMVKIFLELVDSHNYIN